MTTPWSSFAPIAEEQLSTARFWRELGTLENEHRSKGDSGYRTEGDAGLIHVGARY